MQQRNRYHRGSGKSFLAQHACRSGFSARYPRLPTLLSHYRPGASTRNLRSFLLLLVVDDFGLAALRDLEKQDLLEAIEERYGSGTTILTSQLPISDWHEYLGGGRIADAILDRLVHSTHRVELSSRELMCKERTSLKHAGRSDK